MAYPHKVLPVPVRTSYGGTYYIPKKLTKMDDGSTRERRKTKSNPRVVNISWVLTWDQRVIFEAWLRFENVFGQNWVTMPVIAAEADVTVKFIGGTYTINPTDGGGWTASGKFIEKAIPFAGLHLDALPVWPSTLPDYESRDYSMTKIDAAADSDISQYAIPQTRQRFRTINTEFNVGLICTAAQREVLRNFYYNTLIGGTGFFRTKYIDGLTDPLIRVKFASHPEEAEEGALYHIKFTLTTEDAIGLSRSAYLDRVGPEPGDDNDYSPGYFAENYVE